MLQLESFYDLRIFVNFNLFVNLIMISKVFPNFKCLLLSMLKAPILVLSNIHKFFHHSLYPF